MATPYGPLEAYLQESSTPYGLYGRAAMRSLINGNLSYVSGWLPEGSNAYIQTATATDGVVGYFGGSRILATDYGPASYGVQHNAPSNGTYGRFGWFNGLTQLFYPDGSGWFPLYFGG
ncbi:hypothetical protein Rhe02_31140 [Rhizocola hellebori]|uniref:Uncharacterized protein n=1 Tax=Rhizocola hellebori TaxID=1392758 RepID=A0A8J3Q8A2_9ACTN|nr:hypothetical protein Rhe02_31140 [Rhizocola hellebori]